MGRMKERVKSWIRRAFPTPRVIQSGRDRDWTVWQALAEFFDNSFGELRGAASAIWITWEPASRVLTILDNGRGMKNVADLFIMGQGSESGAGDIGKYGVGGSQSGVWLGDVEDVWTLKRGRVAHMRANWVQCIARNEFPIITDAWVTATPANCPTELLAVEHGTLIRLKVKAGLQIRPDDLQLRFSKVFGVALRTGRRVTWTTIDKDGESLETQIRDWNPGKLEDAITAAVVVGDGMTAKVHAGRVDNLSVENSKLSLNYIYRQVKTTTQGFGRPVQGIIGHVDLGPEWLDTLTTNKDNIREECRELETELMTKIEAILRPLVEQMREAKRSKIFTNVKMSLRHRFEAGFQAIVEGSSRGGRGGGVEPPGPGPEPGPNPDRQHKQPAVAEISIEQAPGDQIDGLLCRVEIGEKFAVAWVNKDHALITTALEAEPVNQRLLEQILISALAKEILGSPDGLVRFGLFNKQQAQRMMDDHDGDVLAVLLELIRILTDNVLDQVPAAA